MPKEIELIFPECGNRTLVAVLYEDRAPISCRRVWEILERPLEEKLGHAWPKLPELWFFVPPMPGLPYENGTVLPRAGDVVLYHYDQKGGNYVSPEGRVMAFDIGIYYAQGCSYLPVELGMTGWVSANLVGAIRDPEQLAPVVAHQFLHGKQRIIVRRKSA
ncbi:MAG: DUF3830 family protein [Verrucomicrobiae bacterium]|nr:DUF3830 family protein [Verrucomicrobiae bacterium]